MEMPSPPCYKCEKRHANCHSECPEYIRYKADMDEWNRLRRKSIKESADITLIQHAVETKDRHMKRHGKRFGGR